MTRSPRRLKQQVQDTVGEQVRDLPLHAVRLAMFGVGRALLLGDRVTRDYKEITEGGGVKPVLGRLRDDVQGTAEKVVGRVVERVRGEEPGAEPEPVRRTRVAEPPARPGPAARNGAGNAAAGNAGEEIAIGKPGAGTRHTPKHARPGAPPKPAKPGALGRHHKAAEKEKAKPAAAPEPKPEPKPEQRPAPKPEAGPAPKPKAKPAPRPKAADSGAAAKKGEDEARFEPKPESKPAAPAEAERVAKDLPVPDYDNATLPQLRARLRGLSVDQVKLLREYERKHAAREDVIGMYERRIAKLNGSS
ncbi:hypothetical protein [Actinomadura sp. 9N215]|uniref:hypothetical protein n=1 Tax=Actinomadura sp. 9N215 TaxID=3375150 RepID=UPI0037897253